jgi:hypothetical protein
VVAARPVWLGRPSAAPAHATLSRATGRSESAGESASPSDRTGTCIVSSASWSPPAFSRDLGVRAVAVGSEGREQREPMGSSRRAGAKPATVQTAREPRHGNPRVLLQTGERSSQRSHGSFHYTAKCLMSGFRSGTSSANDARETPGWRAHSAVRTNAETVSSESRRLQ